MEGDTIVVEKPGETRKRLGNLEELDEICKALKVMKLKAEDRNNLAARLTKVIEKMKSEQDEEETKPKQSQFEQLTNMFQEIMKEVKEAKVAVSSTAKLTYAQAAATPPVDQKKTFITPEKKQELEKAKKERKQYELTINMKKSSPQTLESIRKTNAKDITARFQKVINSSVKQDDNPKIAGISRVGNAMMRLQFRTKEEAQRAREADVKWEDAYDGAETHKPNYGIVVHGVPSNTINFEDRAGLTETIMEMEEENASKGIKISRITPLRRNGKQGKPTMHKSIIVFTQDPEAANKCLETGFMFEKERLKTGIYAPHLYINQCYKCQGFGHRSTVCKRMNKCGKCGSEEHATQECKATEPHCANCKGPHEAWHPGCEKRDEEARRLYQLKREASSFFTT